MMNILSFCRAGAVALLLAPAQTLLAQTLQVAKTSATTTNSTFLLGNLTAAKTQSLYLPTDLTGAVAGTITSLSFQYGSTGQATGVTKRRG